MRKISTRNYNFDIETRNDDKNGNHITGRAIVYDSVTDLGWFDEVIAKGALDESDLKDVRFLVNHDTSMIPLARSRNNNENSTMQLIPGDEGLDLRVNLDTENNSDAKNLYSAIQREDVTGMSFMFTVDGEEWERLESDHPTRTITKIGKVFEISAVTFPAYEDTSISARDAETVLKEAREKIKSVRNDKLKNDIELEKLKIKNKYI